MNESLMQLILAYARGYHDAMSLMPKADADVMYLEGYNVGQAEYAAQYQWDAIREKECEF